MVTMFNDIIRTKVEKDTQMRDAVIGRLFDLSEKDKDIIFFTADMGAKMLDSWRKERPNQYRDIGIAEQGMAAIAAGMAKEGKKVFIYAIAPFVTTRIHEFHKLNSGVQKIPYKTIGVGTGFSYPDSGPTHYNTEDIAIMRTVPNMEILSPSDSIMAAEFAEYAAYSNKPVYLRLERSVMPIITRENETFERGFRELEDGKDTCIVSTGNMVHSALEVKNRLAKEGRQVGVIDLYRLKPLNVSELCAVLGKYKKVVTVEEHLLAGGLGSMISELAVDNDMKFKLLRIGISDRLVYYYGRSNIQKELGIDVDTIHKRVANF